MNLRRANPMGEENEKEKEDAMQVSGLLCLKPFNDEGRDQPHISSQETSRTRMDETVKKVWRGLFIFTDTWRGSDSLVVR